MKFSTIWIVEVLVYEQYNSAREFHQVSHFNNYKYMYAVLFDCEEYCIPGSASTGTPRYNMIMPPLNPAAGDEIISQLKVE